jgi:hypothetical protein
MRQREKRPDLFERKAKIPRAADEAQRVYVAEIMVAMPELRRAAAPIRPTFS